MSLCIDHIAICVRDMDHAIDIYQRLLGISPTVSSVPEEGVKRAFFDLVHMKIELISPLDVGDQDFHLNKFLSNRGEGIHHICFKTNDIEKSEAKIRNEGFKFIYSSPKLLRDGSKINFLHPSTTSQVLIELKESDTPKK